MRRMPQTLPPLPYSTSELEPHISAETLQTHYDKHHRAYVEKLNKLIAGTSFENAPLDEIVRQAEGDVYNQAGQHWNHSFFWRCLTPEQKGPSQRVLDGLAEAFGSLAAFRESFARTAITHFGSGWAWLVRDRTGSLRITATHDGGCPITRDETPILTCDVWEHAYYLDHKQDRAGWLDSFWRVVDWRFVEERLRLGQPGTAPRATASP
jgi:Fe-Mn family superoxide dismutase